jgi:hypothetical protein
MNSTSFNPFDLRPLASLNRRQFIDLPGIAPDWIGQTGSSLCSKTALIGLIAAQAAALGLEGVPPADLPRRLNALIVAPDEPIRARAEAIARLHGHQIGYLLASILLAPGGLTTPLDPWEAAYLEHWRQVERIGLGGGRANGALGQVIASAAGEALETCGLGQIHVEALPHPSYLPLIGAARRIPSGDGQVAAVADFGGTHAKSGLAFYNIFNHGDTEFTEKTERTVIFYNEAGALNRLQVLPQLPTGAAFNAEGKAADLAAAIMTVLLDAIRQAPPGVLVAPDVICSVAAYIEDGQPAITPGRSLGAYALRGLCADLPAWFSERLSATCGRPLRFHFAHDCDIAAAALAGSPRTAVVMLGTALGVGFAPPASGFRMMDADFTVQ